MVKKGLYLQSNAKQIKDIEKDSEMIRSILEKDPRILWFAPKVGSRENIEKIIARFCVRYGVACARGEKSPNRLEKNIK